jgi:sulfatase maturation enzyme AslB (radical SAM superfamily)
MPGGKYTPCCAWHGPHFDSPDQIIEQLGPIFKNNQAPAPCQGACPSDVPGWRQRYEKFSTDFDSLKIHFLDFRNSNLCNMKCRSCGSAFSSSWAQELGKKIILNHQTVDFDTLDLSQCEQVYFAGGEPLLNHQHYELLEYFIEINKDPALLYSTNLSSLKYKNKHVGDLWKHFSIIYLNVSIDAVNGYAEFVRTGTVWKDIENNIAWVKQQSNVILTFAPVISAINIWWIDKVFAFVDQHISDPERFQPVLANDSDSIGIIPHSWRPPLIDNLKDYNHKNSNIEKAIHILENVDETKHWEKFLVKQLAIDLERNEHWFENLPIKEKLYQWITR